MWLVLAFLVVSWISFFVGYGMAKPEISGVQTLNFEQQSGTTILGEKISRDPGQDDEGMKTQGGRFH